MPESPSTPAEIRATAHLLTLEPGLYCITHAAGASEADPGSGLPGVRVSPAPAPAAGSVVLCGFSPDGWLGRQDDAVMVRVSGATSPVLVTIYQAEVGLREAPKLQVLRISAPPLPPAHAPAPAAEVVAHVYGVGDVTGRIGDWIGERGGQRWIEGFSVAPLDALPAAELEYQAVLGRGWMSPWADGGEFCGSRGMSLPLLGLNARLKGAAAETHRLELWASFVDGTTVGPVPAETPCMADSLAALEAFQLVLTRKKQARKKR